MEAISLYAIMVVQLALVIMGSLSLYRVVRSRPHKLDYLTVAIGLVSATQLNLNIIRMKYGATIMNYTGAHDWLLSNLVGAACLLFLLLSLRKTKSIV